MTPEKLSKLKAYAKVCGNYVEQMVIVSTLYDEHRKHYGPKDDGCEGLLKALKTHHLPRHMWPMPDDETIEFQREMQQTFDKIIADMEMRSLDFM